MDETFLVSDPQALRALAHPLRQRILFELAGRDHARAADLARTLGEPANSVSFHLRALARAGLVVEAPEHARDGRDRVWRRVADTYQVKADTPGFEAFMAPIVAWVSDVLMREDRDDGGDPDDPHRPLRRGSVSQAWLTRAEADQLADEVAAVVERWHARGRDAHDADPDDPDRIVYQAVLALGPRFDERS